MGSAVLAEHAAPTYPLIMREESLALLFKRREACIDSTTRRRDRPRFCNVAGGAWEGGRKPRKEGRCGNWRCLWSGAPPTTPFAALRFCARKEWLHATPVISHALCTRSVVRGDMTEYICLVHFRCDASNALLAVNNRLTDSRVPTMWVTRPRPPSLVRPLENCAEYFDILDGRNKKATKLEEKGAGGGR